MVLSSDEIKNLIRAKDEEIKQLETVAPNNGTTVATAVIVAQPSAVHGSEIKASIRKRAPVFPFEPEDHYVPDNNSNNVMSR